MRKRLLIVLAALVVLFGGIFGWKAYQGGRMAAQMAAPPPPATVAAERVQRVTWQPYLPAVGSLTAVQGVAVANEIAGIVQTIHFESGQRVAAGELLVQLDAAADRAELAGLVASRRLAELTFERAAKLIKEKTVSRSNYDEARAALDSTTALVAAKQESLRKKAIRAPFAGMLGIRQVDLGQYLPPGTEIVTLQALDPVFVDYALPERYLGTLTPGQTVEVAVQTYPQRRFSGTLSAISPRIETATRSVRIRASLDNPDQLLRPGMFADVRTLQPAQDGVLTLPERAITFNPYGNSVFVVLEKDGQTRVQRRQVETGETRDGRIEIVRGLGEGDQVVSAGHNKLRNDQPVRIDNSIELDGQAGE